MEKAEYYGRRFRRFETGGGVLSWHWPALFITSIWLLYRKMWLYAAIYTLGLPIALGLVIGILAAAVDTAAVAGLDIALVSVSLLYLIFTFILAPLFANWIYYRRVRRKVEKISAEIPSDVLRSAELARIGGTNIAAPIIFLFLALVFRQMFPS